MGLRHAGDGSAALEHSLRHLLDGTVAIPCEGDGVRVVARLLVDGALRTLRQVPGAETRSGHLDHLGGLDLVVLAKSHGISLKQASIREATGACRIRQADVRP